MVNNMYHVDATCHRTHTLSRMYVLCTMYTSRTSSYIYIVIVNPVLHNDPLQT